MRVQNLFMEHFVLRWKFNFVKTYLGVLNVYSENDKTNCIFRFDSEYRTEVIFSNWNFICKINAFRSSIG